MVVDSGFWMFEGRKWKDFECGLINSDLPTVRGARYTGSYIYCSYAGYLPCGVARVATMSSVTCASACPLGNGFRDQKTRGHGITRRLGLTGPNLLVYRMSVSRGETRFLAGPLCTGDEPHAKPSIEVLAVPPVWGDDRSTV
jgi:hypothetical protein